MKTLEFKVFDILQKYNFSKEDAEELIEYMKSASKEEVATKKDLEKLERKLESIETKLDAKIDIAAANTTTKLIQWIAGLMIGQIVAIFSIMKMFGKI